MSRRRQRGVLAVLLTLLTSTVLVTYALSEEGSEASQEEASEPAREAPIDSEEVTAGSSDAAPSAPADREEKESIGYAEEGYEDSAPEQPIYQTQYAAPETFPREQPILQPQSDGTGGAPPLR